MKLREYQENAVKFHLDHSSSYSAVDMGLGKTRIALTWAVKVLQRDPKVNGILVIAPLMTVHTTWPDEVEKWNIPLNYSVLHGKHKQLALEKDADLYIINFEGLPWLFDALKDYYKVHKKLPFQGLILDEGSMVKASNTQRFKILKHLVPALSKWRIILSGTPAPNTLMDLWSQYFLLDGGERLGKGITKFRQEYFIQRDRRGFVWDIRDGSDKKIYEAISDITYRLDVKDHLSLPPILYETVDIRLPDKLLKSYKELEKEFFTELNDTDSVEAFSVMSLSMKLRQFVQGAVYDPDDADLPADRRRVIPVHQEKLKALQSLVESSGTGILCAIQFRFELEIIRKKFPNAPVIAGGVSKKEATKHIRDWNAGKVPLLLCHPASLSHGVNLQDGSSIVLWYGLTWSYEQYAQFNARLYRSGQRKTVVVHHLVAKNTIDTKVYRALKRKCKGMNELLMYLKDKH